MAKFVISVVWGSFGRFSVQYFKKVFTSRKEGELSTETIKNILAHRKFILCYLPNLVDISIQRLKGNNKDLNDMHFLPDLLISGVFITVKDIFTI